MWQHSKPELGRHVYGEPAMARLFQALHCIERSGTSLISGSYVVVEVATKVILTMSGVIQPL